MVLDKRSQLPPLPALLVEGVEWAPRPQELPLVCHSNCLTPPHTHTLGSCDGVTLLRGSEPSSPWQTPLPVLQAPPTPPYAASLVSVISISVMKWHSVNVNRG